MLQGIANRSSLANGIRIGFHIAAILCGLGSSPLLPAAEVSSGTSRDLDWHYEPYEYSLPPGKSPEDIVGMGIAGSNDHVYVWYDDRTVSSGTSSDLDRYRSRYPYFLPPGKSPNDIVGMGIAGSNDHVYAWYSDSTASSGTSSDLGRYRMPYLYSLPPGKFLEDMDIVEMGIAGSNDRVFTWYDE